MRYHLYLSQGAEGCDYTIGCGRQFRLLEAPTLEQALAEARALIVSEYSSEEREVEVARVVEAANEVDLPVFEYYREVRALRDEEKRAAREKAEKAEMERLKLKYEGA